MDVSPLVEQGIAAYKSGYKDVAIRLFSQAIRERQDDELAWLYLGASLDNLDKKRKAFERVLHINPNNEKAKSALARLDPAPPASAAPAVPTAPPTPTPRPANAGPAGAGIIHKISNLFPDGLAVPVQIDGAPARITKAYLVENALPRIRQAFQVYRNYEADLVVQDADAATTWDAVFTAGIGVAAMGASDLVARWIGWILSIFRGSLTLGGLILPLFSATFVILCLGLGFYLGHFMSQVYLEGEQVTLSRPKHAMALASIFLPMTLIAAALGIVNAIFDNMFVRFLVAVILLLDLGYGTILLMEVFDRLYGAENHRSLFAAGLCVAGWIVGLILNTVVLRLFGSIVRFPIT